MTVVAAGHNWRLVPVLLVRHAVALPRRTWPGHDDERPLNQRGRRQAETLVGQLAPFDVRCVLSSPAVRCLGTVEPLAAARRLPVRLIDDVAEGNGHRAVEVVRSMIAEDGDIVVCTHGDVIGEVLVTLEKSGGRLGDGRCQKGSTWVIEQDASGRVRGRYLLPPS